MVMVKWGPSVVRMFCGQSICRRCFHDSKRARSKTNFLFKKTSIKRDFGVSALNMTTSHLRKLSIKNTIHTFSSITKKKKKTEKFEKFLPGSLKFKTEIVVKETAIITSKTINLWYRFLCNFIL